MNLKSIVEQWKVFWASSNGKTLSSVLRTVFILGMLSYLCYQLYQIGITKILSSLPTNPLFYILFLVIYFALPISEQFIYGMSLRFSFWEGMKASVEKKILNGEISYSGEAYYYVWAKNNLNENSKKIFNVIKDNNIISSFSSTLTAIFALAVFSYLGDKSFFSIFNVKIEEDKLIGLAVLIVIVVSLAIYFRKSIISMSASMALKVFAVHTTRIFSLYFIEILMWSVAVPDIPFHVWFVFFAAKIISTRVPFINQDLLFVSISMGLSQEMNILDRPDVVAVLITSTVLSKVTGLVLYTIFLSSRRQEIEDNIRKSTAEEEANN